MPREPSALARRLAEARALHGHTQAECAVRLQELGYDHASQTSVWRWVTGEVQQPRTVARVAITRYIEEVVTTKSPGSTSDDDLFDAALREITFEPLFGDIQREFILARIKRHADGPSLSEMDYAEVQDLARVLRLLV